MRETEALSQPVRKESLAGRVLDTAVLSLGRGPGDPRPSSLLLHQPPQLGTEVESISESTSELTDSRPQQVPQGEVPHAWGSAYHNPLESLQGHRRHIPQTQRGGASGTSETTSLV